MGCGGYPGELRETDAIKIRRDNCTLTRLLCLACERLGDRIDKDDQELATWYLKHQEEDRKRIAREAEQVVRGRKSRRSELERLVVKYPKQAHLYEKELREMGDV